MRKFEDIMIDELINEENKEFNKFLKEDNLNDRLYVGSVNTKEKEIIFSIDKKDLLEYETYIKNNIEYIKKEIYLTKSALKSMKKEEPNYKYLKTIKNLNIEITTATSL